MTTFIKVLHTNLAADIDQVNRFIIDKVLADDGLIKAIAQYLLNSGGKRIRPLLTILSSKMFGYEGVETTKLAAAVEFIHAATLLHDDVVDDSTMRRFKPTANLVWGNKATILVGDYLFSQAFKLMVSTGSLEALESLSEVSSIIVEGEVRQLSKLNEKIIFGIGEYNAIISAKTAALFGAACEVGAIISGQDKEISNILKQFGINLGAIFQINDDALDYFGKSEELGKNIGDDFIEGKVTLPLILLYNRLEGGDKTKLEGLIAKDKREFKDFEWVQDLMHQHNIYPDIKIYVSKLSAEAELLLNKIGVDNEYKDYLHQMLDFAINRSH